MKPGMRMLLLTSRGNDRRNDDSRTRNRYEGNERYNHYDDERMRMEDRQYRMNDDEERMMGIERGVYIEDRFRDRRGREHYDNGRYAPKSYADMHHEKPYIPPIYDHEEYDNVNYRRGGDGRYRDRRTRTEYHEENRPSMRRIGFNANEERRPEMEPSYRGRNEYHPMNEYDWRQGGEREYGHAEGDELPPFDKETAMQWTRGMENEDGSTGPHWSPEQTKQLLTQRGLDCDPWEFYAIMNAIYSDDFKVAKKYGVNSIDYYVDRAKAWLDDKDAMPDKAARYFEYIVKH